MGKWGKDPKYNVFTFRVNDELAEQIRETAKGYGNVNKLLQEAIEEKLQGLNFDRHADSL